MNDQNKAAQVGTGRSKQQDVFARQLNANGKKKRSGWKTAFKVLGGTLLMTGIGAGAWMTLTPQGRAVRDTLTPVIKTAYTIRTEPNLIFDRANSDIVNILLIGRDTNWKIGKVYDPRTKQFRPYQVPDESANARSDTMIVVSLNKTSGTVNMVSIPRDSIVRIPKHGREKLNAAHALGGPDLLLKTLHDELGLTIHHYAVIKFSGFKKIIDKMGGVHVNVDGALKMNRRTGKLYRGDLKYDDNWGNLHINLKPGPQYLNGDQAHGYIRFRMDREGDPGRIRRQQQVMRALAKRLMSQPITNIPPLIEEIKKQFKTDPSFGDDEMASAGWFARGAGAAGEGKISPLTLFAAENRDGSLTLNRPKNEKLLTHIFGHTFNAENFLVRSPETRRDDIGPSNNASSEALKILRAAGVLDPDEAAPRSPVLEAPVKGAPRDRGLTTEASTQPSPNEDLRIAAIPSPSEEAARNEPPSDDVLRAETPRDTVPTDRASTDRVPSENVRRAEPRAESESSSARRRRERRERRERRRAEARARRERADVATPRRRSPERVEAAPDDEPRILSEEPAPEVDTPEAVAPAPEAPREDALPDDAPLSE